jgi:hypothetical protein
MRMQSGDINIYWQHDTLSPNNVRAASYGTSHDSGTLVPEVGDVIKGFPGLHGVPIDVRVIDVDEFGVGVVAYMVTVTTDHSADEEAAAAMLADRASEPF